MKTVESFEQLKAFLAGVYSVVIAHELVYLDKKKEFEYEVFFKLITGEYIIKLKYLSHYEEPRFRGDLLSPSDELTSVYDTQEIYVSIGSNLEKVRKDFIAELEIIEKKEIPELIDN